jgi:hypothetical protein
MIPFSLSLGEEGGVEIHDEGCKAELGLPRGHASEAVQRRGGGEPVEDTAAVP